MSYDVHAAHEVECMRRVRGVLQQSEPTPLEIARARRRNTLRRAQAAPHSGMLIAVVVIGAAALVSAHLVTREAPASIGPVSERANVPGTPAGASSNEAVARDASRLAEAEALHRGGQCRVAKPILEELAREGATPEIRSRAQTVLDEIARMWPR